MVHLPPLLPPPPVQLFLAQDCYIVLTGKAADPGEAWIQVKPGYGSR